MSFKEWKGQLQLKEMSQVGKKSTIPTSLMFHFNDII